jgi:exodeoxyribonuclease-3
MLSIVTWNVNSVKARLAHLLALLKDEAPHVVLLQETKCTDDNFPRTEIEELGYNIALHGQKTYNGVAILSKSQIEDVRAGLPGDEADDHARYIEGVISLPHGALRVASVYVPNGQSLDSDKYPYKLAFYERLRRHAAQLLTWREMLVIGGDYNVAPEALDVHSPAEWQNSVLFHNSARAALRGLLHLGLYDAFRTKYPKARQYSWWDYRANALERDDGLRIDHLLLSAQALDKLEDCRILKNVRAQEKASDHAPVMAVLAVGIRHSAFRIRHPSNLQSKL